MEFLRRPKQAASQQRKPSLLPGQDSYSFRRSRTLTGSMSSQVNAAAENRSRLVSPRLKTHKLTRHRRLIVTGLALSLIAIAGLGWMVSQFIRLPDQLTFTQTLNGQAPEAEYRQTIDKYFTAYPTEKFLSRLQSTRLRDYMTAAHSEIKDITITRAGPGYFDVRIDLRQPVLSWRSDGQQLYVDDSGVSFKRNFFTEPKVAVDDQSGVKLNSTNVVASNRFVQFLGRIVSSVNASDLKVVKVIIPTGTTREVDLVLDKRDYYIKTNIERNPSSQAQDVINAVKHLDSRGIRPQYIDVRIAGKAYYREAE